MGMDQMTAITADVDFELEPLLAYGGTGDIGTEGCSGCHRCAAVE